MGKVGLLIVFSSFLVIIHNIFECHVCAVNLVAAHIMSMQNIHGIEVTSDVYGFSIDQDEQSGIFVQIINRGDGTKSSFDGLSVGWHVYPGLYGDSKTHFYRDGYQRTGCYNLKCPGFVPEANVPMVPGVVIHAVSDPNGVKRTIIFKILKKCSSYFPMVMQVWLCLETYYWLVHLGFDSEPYLIGRFPKSLFTSLGNQANEIQLAGTVVTPTTHLAPMGSGSKQSYMVRQDLPTFMTDKNIYSVSPVGVDGKFTYGGPLE
ncbi:hypothetical protein SETIT_5G373600v2 [Setaria italica]|uniref:Neprosin PEP catalytic domain-containing protein n=1 Tax=Setaria italica TaxID=4555 RepID=A0A368RD86_SETIT|nr:hypothetical protein SETIT_5G373600v2 [Setaria italica]